MPPLRWARWPCACLDCAFGQHLAAQRPVLAGQELEVPDHEGTASHANCLPTFHRRARTAMRRPQSLHPLNQRTSAWRQTWRQHGGGVLNDADRVFRTRPCSGPSAFKRGRRRSRRVQSTPVRSRGLRRPGAGGQYDADAFHRSSRRISSVARTVRVHQPARSSFDEGRIGDHGSSHPGGR